MGTKKWKGLGEFRFPVWPIRPEAPPFPRSHETGNLAPHLPPSSFSLSPTPTNISWPFPHDGKEGLGQSPSSTQGTTFLSEAQGSPLPKRGSLTPAVFQSTQVTWWLHSFSQRALLLLPGLPAESGSRQEPVRVEVDGEVDSTEGCTHPALRGAGRNALPVAECKAGCEGSTKTHD